MEWNPNLAWVEQIHDLKANVDHSQITEQQIEQASCAVLILSLKCHGTTDS